MCTENRKKILFLVPYPFDEAPSQRFRFEQYFDILSANKFEYKISSFFNKKAWSILYTSGNYFCKFWFVLAGFAKRFGDLYSARHVDYVFIHREVAPLGPPFFEWILCRILKKKIIYDFDDSIWMANTSAQNKIATKFKCPWKIKYICKYAYRISAGNEYLANYARTYHDKVQINPTTLKYVQDIKTPKIFNSTITIGWTGTHSTMKYLELIKIPIMKLYQQFDIRFVIISNQKPTDFFVPFTFIKWNKNTEIEDLLQFDIGIMPLADDEWAKGKCGFKALQYMALSIPVIASKVGANVQIISDQIDGYLAANETDWYNKLKLMIKDINLRAEVGLMGNLKVGSSYSTVSNMSNFLSLFS